MPCASNIFAKNSAAGAVHGVDGKFEIRAADEIEVRELGNRLDIGGLQIHLFNFRGCPILARFVRKGGRRIRGIVSAPSSSSIDFMIAGVAEPPNFALNFTPFQFHGLWLEVTMTPPAAPSFLTL